MDFLSACNELTGAGQIKQGMRRTHHKLAWR